MEDLNEQNIALKMIQCKKCRKIQYQNRKICIDCRSSEFDVIEIPAKGKILSFTTLTALPISIKNRKQVGFGIIEIEMVGEKQHVRILAQLSQDSKYSPKIGDTVILKNGIVSTDENGKDLKGVVFDAQ
jgi:uncharacterized OB-fold protein